MRRSRVLDGVCLRVAGGLLLVAALPPTRAQDTLPPDMKPYTQRIPNTDATFDMVPIPAGVFTMGSPADEPERGDDEGPQFDVEMDAFWMGKHEVTWAEFRPFLDGYVRAIETRARLEVGNRDVDAISFPTPIYPQESIPIHTAMGFTNRDPVCNVTQLAAKQYTKWLSVKTGHFYRLPTEAEWEYGCRAGTKTSWSFGEDPDKLGAHAWFIENSELENPPEDRPWLFSSYRRVGLKKPNAWGLYDMHGNVLEWVIDQYDENHYAKFAGRRVRWNEAINWPSREYPRVTRGGYYDSTDEECRCAARHPSSKKWKEIDAQRPQSLWWHTNFITGFRVVRPVREPTEEMKRRFWEADFELAKDVLAESHREVQVPVGDIKTRDR